MREAVSFGQSPCLFLVYGPGFQDPVSVSVYCVLSGTVFCSDVWGFVWSGCCALVDAVACICICCCGCARCIRLWSCHLYLVLFICSVICLLSASWSVHLFLSCSCILLHRHLYLYLTCVQHYILSCILLSLSSVWSGPVPAASSVPVLCPVSCSCYLFSTIWSCGLFRRAVSQACSCPGCCSSWSCILVPVCCPVRSDPCP